MKKYYLCIFIIITMFILMSCKKDESVLPKNEGKKDEFLILVNKDHPLNKEYIPNNLITIHTVDFIKREGETMLLNNQAFMNYLNLYQDAIENNLDLTIFSTYRTYKKQQQLWDNNPNENYVAKPGQSEHQTGLAIDISRRDIGLTTNFMYTKEYQFLINNAYKYGFICRYPKDKEIITGYLFEPWHFRYVGIENAKKIYVDNLTLEEYLS